MNRVLSKEELATLVRLIHCPDLLGETLRNLVFVKKNEGDVGCYSTFYLTPDFKEEKCPVVLNQIKDRMGLDSTDPLEYHRSPSGLEVGWSWESDGLLFFCLADRILINTDCKKPHGWELV